MCFKQGCQTWRFYSNLAILGVTLAPKNSRREPSKVLQYSEFGNFGNFEWILAKFWQLLRGKSRDLPSNLAIFGEKSGTFCFEILATMAAMISKWKPPPWLKAMKYLNQKEKDKHKHKEMQKTHKIPA